MTEDTAVSTETEEREPGSTHTSAHELGDITAQRIQGGLRKLEQTVGAEGDGVDYYRFTLSESREVRLGLKLREGEAELSVEDAEGNVLARSVTFGTHEAAVRTLLPGTYYVRVEAVGTVASAYEFKYGVLEADASYRPDNPEAWYVGTAAKLGMPSFEEAGYGFELSESSDGRVRAEVLGTVLAVDPTGEELSYRIVSGNGSDLFAIDAASGELSYVGAGEDYESGVTSYELTVRASDGTQTVDTTVTVTITDEAEAPAFGEEGYAFALAENVDGSVNQISLGVVEATDPDSDGVRYSLVGGNDSSLFAIGETSGELYYVGAGEDYESGVTSYELTVRASDGTQTIDTTVTVTVTDAADAPAFAEESYAFELAENVDGRVNRLSLGAVTATDLDSDAVRYSLVGGNDSDLFAIGETSGELYYVGAGEDYESGVTSHELTIRASDGTHTIDTTVTVTVTDAAEAPAFAEESYAFELAENVDGSANRLSLGAVTATDPDGDEVRYSLTGGNESMLFNIDAASGELYYVGPGEDYESGVTSHELTVRASDAAHTVDTTVTVTVTNAADAPAFAEESYAFELAENVDGSVNQISLGLVAATDLDSDSVRYSLVGGNDSSLFAIGETSGELYYVGAGEDYESGVTSYELTVRASDGTHASDAAVTVALGDVRGHSEPEGGDLPNDRTTTGLVLVDEAPVTGNIEATWDLDWFAVQLVAGRTYRIDFRGQPTGDGTLVDPFLYGVFDGDGRLIRGTTSPDGGTSYNSRLVFTAPGEGTYYIATSGNGTHPSGTGTYELEVRDVKAPVFAESGYRFALSENAEGSVNRQSLGTVTATDPDGGTVRYRLVGGDESRRFAIDPDTGEVFYVGSGEDYESRVTSHELTVRASDGAYSTEVSVTVTVTDVAEAPAFGEVSYAFELAENSDGRTERLSLGVVTATDPEGDPVRYSLAGGNASDLFAIGAASGELYYIGSGEDFESGVISYELTVGASDGAYSTEVTVTVTVVDDPFDFDKSTDSEKSTEPQGSSEPAGEDLPAGRETNGEVRVNAEPVDGTLRSQSDRDWFAVTLAPGRTYAFNLEGDTPRGGTDTAPAIRGLRDANGDPVAGIVGGTEVRYATDGAAEEAVYYIEVGGQGTSVTRNAETRSLVEPRGGGDGGSDYRLWARDITETRDGTDDYRADTSTTGVVTVGGSVLGEIERYGDRDWFAVELVAGRLYRIDLEGRWTGGGTLRDPYLRGVYDDNGVLLDGTRNDDGGAGGNSRVFFTAPADATYYVDAGAYGYLREGTGTYTLSVKDATNGIPDDFAAGIGTSGTVQVGGSATGEIEIAGDRDWFAVTLQAGRLYRIDLKGSQTGSGTLRDPYLRGVYDDDGVLLDGTTNDDGGTNSYQGAYVDGGALDESGVYINGAPNDGSAFANSRVFVTAEETGIHYVAAGAYGDREGTYTLSVTDVSEDGNLRSDDFAADTTTTGRVAVGGLVTGEIERAGDRDWFAVDLVEGKTYQFMLKGEWYPLDGTLHDVYLRGVHDAEGNLIGGTTDNNSGQIRNALVFYTADRTGIHYVAAGAADDGKGTYTLSVTDIGTDDYAADTTTTGRVVVGGTTTGTHYPGDRDWFAVDLEAGKHYEFEQMGALTEEGTLRNTSLWLIYDADGNVDHGVRLYKHGHGYNARMIFTAREDATYYVEARADGPVLHSQGTYTLSAREILDDYTAETGTTGRLEVGESIAGEVNIPHDRDWFAVTLQEGRTYRIDLKGFSTSAGTLWSPYLHGVHDAHGALLDGTTNDDGGAYENSRVTFKADATATYYVAAGGDPQHSDVGTYTLSVTDVTDGVPDDYSADTSRTGSLTVGGSATGEIDDEGDEDWFAVTLEAGQTYRIDLEGHWTGAGTLYRPYLRGVHDAEGNLIDGTTNDNGGARENSRMTFRADVGGIYYVAAGAYGDREGTYTLSVTDVTDGVPEDDYAADTSTTGSLTVGGSAMGKVDYEGDEDWFAVTLEAGQNYRIDLKGSQAGAGTLYDPYLRGVHDAEGNLLDDTTNDSGGNFKYSLVYFKADVAGPYYVAAGARGDLEGTYTLSVEEVTDGM